MSNNMHDGAGGAMTVHEEAVEVFDTSTVPEIHGEMVGGRDGMSGEHDGGDTSAVFGGVQEDEHASAVHDEMHDGAGGAMTVPKMHGEVAGGGDDVSSDDEEPVPNDDDSVVYGVPGGGVGGGDDVDGGEGEHDSGKQAGMVKGCPGTMAALLKKKGYKTVVKKDRQLQKFKFNNNKDNDIKTGVSDPD